MKDNPMKSQTNFTADRKNFLDNSLQEEFQNFSNPESVRLYQIEAPFELKTEIAFKSDLASGENFLTQSKNAIGKSSFNFDQNAIFEPEDSILGISNFQLNPFTDDSQNLTDAFGKIAPASTATTPQTISSSSLINLDDFWADSRFAGIDGSGFATVIIDTGIDLNHPFFGADADNNGIADRIVYQYDFADNDADASDYDGHGSHVSSIVASSDSTYTGVAPGVDIIHLKVFSDSGSASLLDIEEALQWVVANAETYNIASVNMSLGFGNFDSPKTTPLSDELAELTELNVLTVSAAGNSYADLDSLAGVTYPAADPNSLAIGAVYDKNIGSVNYGSGATAYSTSSDQITPFSQRDATLTTLVAPGAAITGANHLGGTSTLHGTSQAAPHVAGTVALAQELAVQELGRLLSVEELTDLLVSSGESIYDGDDENDNVVNTGLEFQRLDVFALGEAILDLAPSSTTIGAINSDFDTPSDLNLWETINLGSLNSQFSNTDGNALFFTGSGTRQAITPELNTTAGGEISFDLIIGNNTNGGENADIGEDIVLEYSINGNAFTVLNTYDSEDFTSFTTITEVIPTSAQSASTQFRWRQVSNSGSNYDQWAIDNVEIGSTGRSKVYIEDSFDPNLDNSQWEAIANGAVNNSFGGDSDALFFTGSGSRLATTQAMDIYGSGTISFDLIFGNSANGGENADAGEDVALEFSTNGGSSWSQMALYDTEAFTDWTAISETISLGAQSDEVQFRWTQIDHSGSNFDQWAIDNVVIEGV